MVETRQPHSPYEAAATGAGAATGARAAAGTSRRVDERRARPAPPASRDGDILEDAVPLVGILVGGALGYLAAMTLSGAGGGRSSARSAPSRSPMPSAFAKTGYGHGTGEVEHDETADMIASNKVEGTAVYNRMGEKLGEVYNFMVGKRSGRVAYAVISFGGFLGIGLRYHAVPWNALTYFPTQGGFVIDTTRDRLMNAPHYGSDEDPFARPGYDREVQAYWSSGLI